MSDFPSGLRLLPGFLEPRSQAALLIALNEVLAAAPLYVPRMPKTGTPLSVRMTNCGSLGWITDESGYRYEGLHPETGRRWPPIPAMLIEIWESLARYPHAPEACLVNYYGPAAKMGLHQDRDEQDFAAPVVSLSLGDSCIFRIGGKRRRDPTRTVQLASGDAVVLAGDARLAFHGVDRIIAGTSRLLPQGGRINVTLRRVSYPQRADTKPRIGM
jgi:DNA oxidative demethylase